MLLSRPVRGHIPPPSLLPSHPSCANYFKILQFQTRNWVYIPNQNRDFLKIRIPCVKYLKFAPPFQKSAYGPAIRPLERTVQFSCISKVNVVILKPVHTTKPFRSRYAHSPFGSALQARNWLQHESRHDKTNKVTLRPANSDQPGHPPSMIRVFVVRLMGS